MDQPATDQRESTPPLSPRDEYGRRLAAARARADHFARRDDAGANLRLALFVGAVVLAGMAYAGSVAWWWPVGVLVAFAVLVVVHGRATAARRQAEAVVDYYRRGLDRLDGVWSGRGNRGERFRDEAHPYASDLDLFGVGSIFERLCLAQTAAGEQTLADWLLHPAHPDLVRDRQAAVDELRPRLALREDLAFLGRDARAGGDPAALARWGGEGDLFGPSPALRWGVLALVAATVGALVAWLAEVAGPQAFLGLLAVECAVALGLRRRVDDALDGVAERAGELRHLAALVARIERERFATSREPIGLRSGPVPVSARLARLARSLTWLEARHNTLFTLVAAMLLWRTQFGLAVAAWRAAHGRNVEIWLREIGRVEALSSLAGYAYENPDDVFPEIVVLPGVPLEAPSHELHIFVEVDPSEYPDDPPQAPILEADDLGHPLIAAARCVRNTIRLGAEPRVLAVSGSNMSGKSTWLRTVGANVVLAQAGAPVRATRMRLSPLMVGGTLTVHDSLQEGRSRFYAEILRLRQLLDLAKGDRPLLFLIDEVLAGTNSHDRLRGAEAVVRGLLDRGALGLFTTHDLALTAVADRLAPLASNVHFDDHLDPSGQLAFDYRMKPGVVDHSNALALMRAVGLEV